MPCCRFGSLYGELARFILRLLGFKTERRKGGLAGAKGAPGAEGMSPGGPVAGPPALPGMLGGPALGPAGPAGGGDNWNSLWSS